MDTKLDSYWMLPNYMTAVGQAGGLPLMLPFQYDDESIDRMVELCDGLVFTGGEDIDPSRYHEERLPVCGESIPIRDELEIRLLRAALAAKKPVLCICRGLQLFNVVMGGTLWQDLPSQRPSEIKHSQGKPYGAAHPLCGTGSGQPAPCPAGTVHHRRQYPSPSGHPGTGSQSGSHGNFAGRPD